MDYADVLTHLRRIIRSVNLESKRIEKEYGISIPQLLCLKFLNGRPQFQASHKEIKDFLSLNASTVTGIINRLERKGLVAKLPRRDDRRVSYVTITAKGADILNNPTDLIHERISKKLRRLTPAQLDELKSAIHLLTNFLELGELDASPIITGDLSMKPPPPEGNGRN